MSLYSQRNSPRNLDATSTPLNRVARSVTIRTVTRPLFLKLNTRKFMRLSNQNIPLRRAPLGTPTIINTHGLHRITRRMFTYTAATLLKHSMRIFGMRTIATRPNQVTRRGRHGPSQRTVTRTSRTINNNAFTRRTTLSIDRANSSFVSNTLMVHRLNSRNRGLKYVTKYNQTSLSQRKHPLEAGWGTVLYHRSPFIA